MRAKRTNSYFAKYLRLPTSDAKAVRQAFYNAAAFIVLFIICMALLGVYYTLHAFLSPLVWAVLCGIALYPIKNSLTRLIRGWLCRADAESRLLITDTLVVPFHIFSAVAVTITDQVTKYSKFLRVALVFYVLLCFLSFFNFSFLPRLFSQLYLILIYLVNGVFELTSIKLTFTIGVLFVCTCIFTRQAYTLLTTLSYIFWLSFVFWIASLAGVIRIPLLTVYVVCLVAGYMNSKQKFGINMPEESSSCFNVDRMHSDGNMRSSLSYDTILHEPESPGCSSSESGKHVESVTDLRANDGRFDDGHRWSMFIKRAIFSVPSKFEPALNLSTFFSDHLSASSLLDERNRCKSVPETMQPRLLVDHLNAFPSAMSNSTGVFVNRCFLLLGWSHFLVAFWLYHWPFQIICITFICIGVVRLARYAKIIEHLYWIKDKLMTNFSEEQKQFYRELIIPKPIQGLYNLLVIVDKKMRLCLDSSLDAVVSLIILILVIFGFCLLTLFLVFQIHEESIRLVSLTSDLLNQALNSESCGWLPKKEHINSVFGILLTNTYQAGKTWISDKTDELFESDPTNKALFQAQLLEIWETIYNTFVNQTDNLHSTSGTSAQDLMNSASEMKRFYSTNDNYKASLHQVESTTSHYLFAWNDTFIVNRMALSSLFLIVQRNLGTLATIIESLWGLMHSNLNLLAYLLTAMISLILSGGHVFMNFIISLLIFLTVLFYLLAASGSRYLPVAFITSLTPAVSETGPVFNHFYSAVESAISGVFAATFKLAVFYGLYTTLTHTVFGLDIVVIPSVLAALFGAIPILGTYWAAIPGAIEIILVRHSLTQAGLLITLHLLPTYFVDVAIYREIKGAGHPYLTGLAIAGGVYYQGPEGALVGPIILCCLLVAVNLYRWSLGSSKIGLVHDLLGLNKDLSNSQQQHFNTRSSCRFCRNKFTRRTSVHSFKSPTLMKPAAHCAGDSTDKYETRPQQSTINSYFNSPTSETHAVDSSLSMNQCSTDAT